MTPTGGHNWRLALGRWQETLADLEVDALITDPPYGARVHKGWNDGTRQINAIGKGARRDLSYGHLEPEDVREFVDSWSPRVRGWIVVMTSHDLVPYWEGELEAAGRYTFAPLPIIMHRPRLLGDGPSSAAIWAVVARPRTREAMRWGCLPGWYHPKTERGLHIGGKPLGLLRALVGDYTDPGDLVCDPFAGYGTTLRAAVELGCKAIGSELDRDTWGTASELLAKPFTPYPHPRSDKAPRATQTSLF